MKLQFLLIIISATFQLGFCQNKIISGEILHHENDEPIAYVNIGIKDKSVGTVSNKNGKFKLVLNENVTSNDTVIFSFMGFKTKKYLVSELSPSKNLIRLQPQKMELDEVVVSSKKIKLRPKKLGRSIKGLSLMHAGFYNYYEKDVDDRLSKEKGVKLKIKRNCHIKDLNFNITSNDFKSLKFRVNFYRIENGLPTDLIVHENIIFEIKDNFLGWFTVDLEPYEIFLKEEIKEVAVTIQWLESVKSHEKGKYFAISAAISATSEVYSREKAMDLWTNSGFNLSFYLNAMCE